MSYQIVSISNEKGAPEQAILKLQKAAACPGANHAEMFKFEVPSLMVGTLDSLISLSDDLTKTDAIVEGIMRKVEKTGQELSSFSGKKSELTVGGVPAKRYIQQFAWDYAKYPNRRPLKELVSLISGGASSIDEELKLMSTAFADKMAALTDAKRKKSGNLMSVDLNDVLTVDVMRNVTVHDTEYLKTVFVAVPKGSEEDFMANIEKVGTDLVGYGGPDWSRNPRDLGSAVQYGSLVDRHGKRGSPVIPGSIKLVKEDNDSTLFTVTILKGQYEAGYYEGDEFVPGTKVDFETEFVKACRDKRFVVRQFTYDPNQASKSALALETLQVEVDGNRSGLTRWCKTHFGEAFVAWMHIKVIRVFVESVLRYGLPVDFTAVLYKALPGVGKDMELTDALDKAFGTEDSKEDDDEEYHEFVLLKFDP
jgi:V-type H+-transporting ATPase subunit C